MEVTSFSRTIRSLAGATIGITYKIESESGIMIDASYSRKESHDKNNGTWRSTLAPESSLEYGPGAPITQIQETMPLCIMRCDMIFPLVCMHPV
jgi:hypothetical protein